MNKNGLYTRAVADLAFHKAEESASSDNCVGVAFDEVGNAYIRDEKNPDRPVLAFTPHEWRCFISGIQRGQANLLGS